MKVFCVLCGKAVYNVDRRDVVNDHWQCCRGCRSAYSRLKYEVNVIVKTDDGYMIERRIKTNDGYTIDKQINE